MKRIYLVRHGQTNANVTQKCQGPEEPLSEVGETQAYRLAERIKELSFQKIIASDYVRTQQTAQPIRDYVDVPFETSALFREERWPAAWLERYETEPEIKEFVDNLILKANDETWRVEDAENSADIHNRIIAALEFLKNDPAEEIVVVSHGSFLKQLVGHVLLNGKGTHEEVASFKNTMKTINTGISVIVFEKEKWRLLTWNDHAHFAE